MKGILLAGGMTIVLFVAVTGSFRLLGRVGGIRRMLVLYALCGALIVLSWSITYRDLGILPSSLLTEPPWLDLGVSLFLFSAAFFGGILQLYNLADRGFSLRFLIDLLERGTCASASELMDGYSAGKGIGWMYGKRLHGLLDKNFIEERPGKIALTAKGEAAAAFFLRVSDVLYPKSSPR
jgi:hypothetical protein